MTDRLSQAQRDLQAAVGKLADERIAPRAADIDASGDFPWDVVELLAAHDVFTLPYPEAYGGLGGELLNVCLAVEQLARACATSSLILAVQALASLPLLLAGTEAQKARWLPDLAAGKALAAFAITEAEAGSDAAAVRTRAIRTDDGAWRIDGAKRFISQGSVARIVAVFALTDPSGVAVESHHHLTCFEVERDSPGFSIGKLEHKMGMRGSPTAELHFDGVPVPDANRVGEVGEGWSIAMRTLERSRPGIAAQAVGISQGALEVAVRYAGERRQFGRPIGEFEMVAALLADMATRTEAARQLLYTACEAIDGGQERSGRWAAMAKLFCGDTAMAVTTDAVQVLGGYGYLAD
ncbi:MAG TPA: acyl-CoA dehydrogenase family protein, partial [Candidatus Limnocylindrales bacterium]|nr:acyl-CoA dehydrogenase family protein [Candidatus Limnocylindrales bacterium]